MDPIYLSKFDSIYNNAVHKWAFIADEQKNGIESIKTEAEKLAKPTLAEELLMALATTALGFGISWIGSGIAAALEKRLVGDLPAFAASQAKMLKADLNYDEEMIKFEQSWITNRLKLMGQVAKAANDAFKDGVKSLTGPRVKKLAEEGKLPIHAFFEGQLHSVPLAADEATEKMENSRSTVLSLSAIHPVVPILAAIALRDSMHEQLTTAEDVQKKITLKNWLLYLAQINAGAVEVGSVALQQDIPATDLSELVQVPSIAYQRTDPYRNTPGVVYVDADLNTDYGTITPLCPTVSMATWWTSLSPC
jgi:hypothetical protein